MLRRVFYPAKNIVCKGISLQEKILNEYLRKAEAQNIAVLIIEMMITL